MALYRNPDPVAWSRLAEAMAARRAELGLTQEAAAVKCEVGISTWADLERCAKTVARLMTLSAVARALEWPNGRPVELLDGVTPPVDPLPPAQRSVDALRGRVRALEETVAELLREREMSSEDDLGGVGS